MSHRSITSFSELYLAVRDTSSSEEKVTLIAGFLKNASNSEFGWAVYLLRGGNLRGGVRSKELREWAAELSNVPLWLVEESYSVTGDLAETIALLVCKDFSDSPATPTLNHWIKTISKINSVPRDERKQLVLETWRGMSQADCLVFNKLITGGLRIGVAKGLVTKALERASGIPSSELWTKLAGSWRPDELTFEAITTHSDSGKSVAPYPFFLAYPLERDILNSYSIDDWQVEWKWDGIRAQIVKRHGGVAIWSRGDELISESFPEIVEAGASLSDGTVLDGEIVAWNTSTDGAGHPASFADLQKRIKRKRITSALLNVSPTRFIAYDILETDGRDIRTEPLSTRRNALEKVVVPLISSESPILISATIESVSWQQASDLQRDSRARHAEGLMLKRRDSPYGTGRANRGAWWKWKVEPLTIDGVLLYATKGHGRRADLYTDYTFAVWDGDKLVTFAKAYSGLTESEIREVDAFIKRNTKERFGPVRTVEPELVFEIAFEGIQESKRHRSGVAVRFPRILRWRRDKSAKDADTLEALRNLAENRA
jgi:DNA ligase-1